MPPSDESSESLPLSGPSPKLEVLPPAPRVCPFLRPASASADERSERCAALAIGIDPLPLVRTRIGAKVQAVCSNPDGFPFCGHYAGEQDKVWGDFVREQISRILERASPAEAVRILEGFTPKGPDAKANPFFDNSSHSVPPLAPRRKYGRRKAKNES